MGIFWTIIIGLGVSALFFGFQFKFFRETAQYRSLFNNFFKRKDGVGYATKQQIVGDESFTVLCEVGMPKSDLNDLIREINKYVCKSRGTTDFSVIQNKVERKLNMRYDQSSTHLSFPTYLGLMGTFLGLFIGILTFLLGFDSTDSITDDSISNLLIGVLVSMSTSFVGLFLTTRNTALAGSARKKIEEDKNEFYDFVQTELMPTLNVSLVVAIDKLHTTVDNFEPSFNRVIDRFQTTFDNCTKAFGTNFEKNVSAVANAVNVMGQNMDKINENISLQEKLISTMKGDQLVRGLENYVEAANHFVSITQSLNKFEEARRMMLAAAQESIRIQNAYSESLKIPQNVAVKISQILDRVKNFEDSLNKLGDKLNEREILGNDVVKLIRDQVNAIAKKAKIADAYYQKSDGKMNDLFKEQTELIGKMTTRYREAIERHIESFDKMMVEQTTQMQKRNEMFMKAIDERLSIEDVRKEFSNLAKLSTIDNKLQELATESLTSQKLHSEIESVRRELSGIKDVLEKKTASEDKGGILSGLFK